MKKQSFLYYNHYGVGVITLPERVDGSFLFNCLKKEDYYLCYSGGGGYVASGILNYLRTVEGRNSILIKKYERKEETEENLYLYIKFARIDFTINNKGKNVEDYSFRIYKYGDKTDLVENKDYYLKDYFAEHSTKTFQRVIYENFKDKMTTYKITYKIDGGNYLLSSVEPVE